MAEKSRFLCILSARGARLHQGRRGLSTSAVSGSPDELWRFALFAVRIPRPADIGPLMPTPLSELLKPVTRMKLDRPPVAVAFLATPPPGLARINRPLPAACSYWKHASEGNAFYT